MTDHVHSFGPRGMGQCSCGMVPGESAHEALFREYMARVLDVWGHKLAQIERFYIIDGAVDAMRRAMPKKSEGT